MFLFFIILLSTHIIYIIGKPYYILHSNNMSINIYYEHFFHAFIRINYYK